MKYNKSGFLVLFFAIITVTCFCCADSSAQQEDIKHTGIDRTLYLLNNSTKEQPNQVEILFYGQSIIGGMKTSLLVDSLKARFPYAKITYKHKPIGGFTIPDLTKTVQHDVYQENPDLIIFHAYDGIEDSLYDAFIKNIRKQTPADILLLDHHYVWDTPSDRLESINKSHDFDSKAIQTIAKKYNCGFVNVREQWKTHLEENTISPNQLMGNTIDPNVHPNEKGNRLLRQIVLSKFPKSDAIDYNIKEENLRIIIQPNQLDKDIEIPSTTTNVELVLERSIRKVDTCYVEVFIDDKKPSEFRSSYHIERPSKGFESWMPGISRVTLGKPFPIEEEWTITIFDMDREHQTFKFKLEGEKTGFDGEGNNTEKFLSNSKRIRINGADFNLFRIEKILKNETPENFKIKFRVNQIIKDTIKLEPDVNKYKLFRSNSAQHQAHKLKINVVGDQPNIKHLMISTPYITD
ncbi:hypothetical protein [uncultured Psychroserpens sp.]|uniref:SGNH/GDSL hydrolase family protein n=1 Tax=uncultured Psychroserpens sp. TaxID=255436 RepID=UPI0026397AFA|nr:hypothetical protein [uncultured Psychroserpens sp.]